MIVFAVVLLLVGAALGGWYYHTKASNGGGGGVPAAAERYNGAAAGVRTVANPTFHIDTTDRARTGNVIATTANSTQYLIPIEQAAGEYLEPVARNEDYTYAPPFEPPVDPTLVGGPHRTGDDALDYAEVDDPRTPGANGAGAGAAGGGGRLALDEDNYVAGGELPSHSASPYTRPLLQYAVVGGKGRAAAAGHPPTASSSEYVADGYDASAAGVYGGVYGSTSGTPGIYGSAADYATPTVYATPTEYGDAAYAPANEGQSLA